MIKIIMKNGEKFEGKNITEVVEELRRDCKVPSSTKIKYKYQLAKRFRIYYGKRLSFINDENFLYGLLEAGEIKSIEDNEDEKIFR